MSLIKQLASQTAVYGVSSIVGRFLNYLLVPIHVRLFTTAQYGVITYFYSLVSFLAVLLTYGMETALFKFSAKEDQKQEVFSTAFLSVLLTSSIFFGIIWFNAHTVARLIQYPQYSHYVKWFAAIMAIDSVAAVPFAQLRLKNKAWKFAGLRLINIGINIGFNLIFLFVFPQIGWYDISMGVGYVFLANLIASASTLLLLLLQIDRISFRFNFEIWRKMLAFSIPLTIAGLAGMVNETFDRIALRYLLPSGPLSEHQIGVYGGVYKLAMLMSIFIQAYRFAAEPFFLARCKEEDNLKLYARSMNYFVAVCCLIFLVITFYLEWIKFFLDPKYFEGIFIVPILLMANLFLGMYVNFSMWFKLSGNTQFGMLFSFLGAGITIAGLWILVPIIGYSGAAWTTLACYFAMALTSFWVGQSKYPIPYNSKRIGIYLTTALLFFALNNYFFHPINATSLILKNLFIVAFVALVFVSERAKKVVA